jgi:hypothetical protein
MGCEISSVSSSSKSYELSLFKPTISTLLGLTEGLSLQGISKSLSLSLSSHLITTFWHNFDEKCSISFNKYFYGSCFVGAPHLQSIVSRMKESTISSKLTSFLSSPWILYRTWEKLITFSAVLCTFWCKGNKGKILSSALIKFARLTYRRLVFSNWLNKIWAYEIHWMRDMAHGSLWTESSFYYWISTWASTETKLDSVSR